LPGARPFPIRNGVEFRRRGYSRTLYLTFFIASCLAAVAGVLVGLLNNLVEPGMGNIISYKGLAIIVLGGLGNVFGTLVASLVLGLVESFGTIYLHNVHRPRRDRVPVSCDCPDDPPAGPVRVEVSDGTLSRQSRHCGRA
jgi:hypothetical protein